MSTITAAIVWLVFGLVAGMLFAGLLLMSRYGRDYLAFLLMSDVAQANYLERLYLQATPEQQAKMRAEMARAMAAVVAWQRNRSD